MLRALTVSGAMLIVVGVFLASPARDMLPVELLLFAEHLVSGQEVPRYVKLVPAHGNDGLPLVGMALAGAGVMLLLVSYRLGRGR